MAAEQGRSFPNNIIIPELLDIVKRIKPIYSEYAIDELTLQHNKTVLRLPPYHCELNPIELRAIHTSGSVRSGRGQGL